MPQIAVITDELAPDLGEALDIAQLVVSRVALRRLGCVNAADLTETALKAAADELANRNLACISVLTSIGKASGRGAGTGILPRENLIARLLRARRIAAHLDAKYVRFFASEAVLECLPALHQPEWFAVEVELDTLAPDSASAIALARRTGVGVVLDPTNAWRFGAWGPRTLDEIDLSLVVDIHVKDVDTHGNFVAPGEGVIRWDLMLRQLRERRYDGCLTVETHLDAGRCITAVQYIRGRWYGRGS